MHVGLFVFSQIAKRNLSVSDLERLIMYGQMHVDVVRRVGRLICQVNHRILQMVHSPPLVRLNS